MNTMEQQAAYRYWANGRWIAFVYSQPGHAPYLYQLASHIIKGERAWLERITGQDGNRDLWETRTEEALFGLAEANRQNLKKIFERAPQGRGQVKRLNGQVYEPRFRMSCSMCFFIAKATSGSWQLSAQYPDCNTRRRIISHGASPINYRTC
jgi:hypothetical protein